MAANKDKDVKDMDILTADQLNAFKKDKLISIIMKMREREQKHDEKLLLEISSKIDILTSQLTLQKTITDRLVGDNSKLRKKIASLEERVLDVENDINQTDNYIRRNNIEIHGIPINVENQKLEETIIKIAKEVNVEVKTEDIEACHRLRRQTNSRLNPVIVRFVNRKFCEKLHNEKTKLKDLTFNDIFGANTQLFFNENLCPYYLKLFGMCYKLKKAGLIDSVWSFHGHVYYRVQAGGDRNIITDENELKESFPDFFPDKYLN